MSIEITEEKREEIFENFINNTNFYKKSELKKVREIIVIDYCNDSKKIIKIAQNKRTRQLLSSPALLVKMMNKPLNDSFLSFEDEKITNQDIYFIIDTILKHEDEFINYEVRIKGVDFLKFIIENKKDEIGKDTTELSIKTLFLFLNKTCNRIEILLKDKSRYESLFNIIEQAFISNSFKHAVTWFQFYYYFRDYNQFDDDISSKVLSQTMAFLKTEPNAKRLKNVIETVLDFKDFIETTSAYSNQIYKRSLLLPEFSIEFYSFFDDEKKQAILESWVSKNSKQATEVIKGINNDIPNRFLLANKIVSKTNSPNINLKEKDAYFDLMFSLGLEKDEKLIANYTSQISNYIFNNNLQTHEFGLKQLKKNRKFVQINTLSNKAESFLISLLGNINVYHKHIQNLIESKLGITTATIDKEIYGNQNRLNRIYNYLFSSGDIGFYKALISKLKQPTINAINERFVITLNKNLKFLEIANHIKKNNIDGLSKIAKSQIEKVLE